MYPEVESPLDENSITKLDKYGQLQVIKHQLEDKHHKKSNFT